MTKAEFLLELDAALELEPGTLAPGMDLSDTEAWDSMAALIFMSLADEKLQISLSGDQLAACRTVSDLLDLVGNGLTG